MTIRQAVAPVSTIKFLSALLQGETDEGLAMGELEKARSANLFATPALAHVWSDSVELNGLLRDAILAYEQTHPSVELTNVGGWHSAPGRLEFCGAAGARLLQKMQEMTEEATRRLFAESERPI